MDKIHSIVITDNETKATGRAKGSTRPYDFEIYRPLTEMGYSVKVTDILPAKDHDGYEWTAEIMKRDPMIVTEKEYYKMTNCSGGYHRTEFSVEQVQQILIDHGYEIIVHYGKTEVEETQSEWGSGEVRRTGRVYIEDRPRILAVTPEQKKNLPEWNSSHAAYLLDFFKVFDDLIKAKLSNPLDTNMLLKRIEAVERKLKMKDDEDWTRNVEQNERR